MKLPPQQERWSKGTMRAKPQQNHDLFPLFSFLLPLFSSLQIAEDLAELLLENTLFQLKRVEKTSSFCFMISCSDFVFDGVLLSYNSPSQQTLQWPCFEVSGIINSRGQVPSYLHPFTLKSRKPAGKTMKNS